MENALCAQVFIDIRPVDRESAAGYAPVGALLRRRRQKARCPSPACGSWTAEGIITGTLTRRLPAE